MSDYRVTDAEIDDELTCSDHPTGSHATLVRWAQEIRQLRAELAAAVETRDLWCKQCNLASEWQAETSSRLNQALARIGELEGR